MALVGGDFYVADTDAVLRFPYVTGETQITAPPTHVVDLPAGPIRPSGLPIPVLTGFVTPDGDALGRPVGVAIDKQGALLVADDVGNAVWRVSRGGNKAAAR